MMMNTTLEQLRGLKLNGMAASLQEQLTQAGMTAMSFEERVALLAGAVKVVAAKSSMLKRLVFLFDSDPLVFAG